MIEIRIPHQLGIEQARERLESVARRHDLRLEVASDGLSGSVEKKAPFVGIVRARYHLREDALELTVADPPALLPEKTLRRMLEDELVRAFAGNAD